jgi:endo-1,4-beta-xylanase
MVTFSRLILSAFAITGSLASPTANVERDALSPANFVLGRDNALRTRQNYQQDYTTGGDVIFSPDGNYYKVAWDTEDDFVVGIGWTTGSRK